jgi:Ser/Thr protein kinase RdoA (MazF antagonist)
MAGKVARQGRLATAHAVIGAGRRFRMAAFADLGRSVQAWSRVSGGSQNRLFQLQTDNGPPLLLKVYAVNHWPRLETEYATLAAVKTCYLACVPQALLRADEWSYAVYSFETGALLSARELTRAETIAAFAADLHRLGPDDVAGQLTPAVDAMVSPATDRRMIDGRLKAAQQRLPELQSQVNRLLDRLIGGAGPPLPRPSWRLTTGDFGPQNMLLTTDGALTVLDFESAGWDDPAHASWALSPTPQPRNCRLSCRVLSWQRMRDSPGSRLPNKRAMSASAACWMSNG